MRIDWGYLYVAAPQTANAVQSITPATEVVNFFRMGNTTASSSTGKGLMVNTVLNLGMVGKAANEQFILLGYDDIYSFMTNETNACVFLFFQASAFVTHLKPPYLAGVVYLEK